uniref:Uncharacterized protein n=1 Tax=viral metagenome TaxID=1070528 RepID=A0A6C0BHM6_9ZZZZ
MVYDFDSIRFRNLVIVGSDAFDFYDFHFLHIATSIAKNKGTIFRHAFHRDHRSLTALNDKVSTHIFGTFTHFRGMNMFLVMKETVFRSDHNRNLSKVNIGKDTHIRFTNTVAGMVNESSGHFDIHIKRGGVRQIA